MDFDEMMKKVGIKMNEVRDIVMDFTDKAGKKAGEIYGDTKIKLKIADVQRDISKLYKEIGKAAYIANRAGEDVSAVINDKCDEVERLEAEMEELAKGLAKAKAEAGETDEADDVIEVEAVEDEVEAIEAAPEAEDAE